MNTRLFPLLSQIFLLPCAAEVASRPVVIESIDCPSDAVTTATLPFFHSVAFQDALASSPAAASGGLYNLTVKKSGTWTNNELSGTHAIYFLTGPWAGRLFAITSDLNGLLTIPGHGKSLESIPAGTDFEVVKLWSTENLLPVASQTAMPEAPVDPLDRSSSLRVKSHPPYRTNALVNYPANGGAGWINEVTSSSASNELLFIPETLSVIHDSSVPSATKLILAGIQPSITVVDDLDDSDNDSLSDTWELTYATNLNVLGATGTDSTGVDSDQDGLSDALEEELGTSPIDGSSIFEPEAITPVAGGMNVSWATQPGVLYQVSYSLNLGSWTPLGSPRPGLGGNMMIFIPDADLPANPDDLFFRISATTD